MRIIDSGLLSDFTSSYAHFFLLKHFKRHGKLQPVTNWSIIWYICTGLLKTPFHRFKQGIFSENWVNLPILQEQSLALRKKREKKKKRARARDSPVNKIQCMQFSPWHVAITITLNSLLVKLSQVQHERQVKPDFLLRLCITSKKY